jgi:hypothetical protein
VLPRTALARCRAPDLAEIRLTDAWADRNLVVIARDLRLLGPHARLFVDELVAQSESGGSSA